MRIAVLGLGIIGSAWAANLRADGHEVRSWNRTPKQVPGFVEDPARAATGAEVAIIVVSDPPAVDSVLARILPALAEGQVVVQSSTVDAACNRRCAERVAATGALFLEAPFTGSKLAAEARQTVFYVGGEAATLERARPALAPLSKAIQHVGPLGAAATLKLAMNVNIALVGQALCESLAYARSAGISDAVYFDALRLNASRSGVADLKEPKLRAGDVAAQFSLKHMDKDLRLAAGEAGALPLSLLTKLREVYAEGMRRGWGDDDFSGLMRLLKK
jgi:3-hydroxyisobutyrate dehydrogenase-like beta-hydroxyacid dehydrogenase